MHYDWSFTIGSLIFKAWRCWSTGFMIEMGKDHTNCMISDYGRRTFIRFTSLNLAALPILHPIIFPAYRCNHGDDFSSCRQTD